MFGTHDWSIHLGPLDLECEHGKSHRNVEWPMEPTLRLISKTNPECDRADEETKAE
jgi:hypothetical protein